MGNTQHREKTEDFEQRKRDHISLSLDSRTQTTGMSGLEQIELIHEALPEMNFDEVNSQVEVLNTTSPTPLFVSSMTAGHKGSFDLNHTMAEVCSSRGWLMGVGSQRRELGDTEAAAEWSKIRKSFPEVKLLGNIGLSQLIYTETSEIQRLVDNLQASALFVHLNALQECLQPEGTPQFKNGIKAIEKICKELSVPVIIKETGCGFSAKSLDRLNGLGLYAVDVAGLGGTHWGRIEGHRSQPDEKLYRAAESFKDWGISTLDSLQAARTIKTDYEVWASGGIRSGLDAAKCVAVGAKMVGLAKPIIAAAVEGSQSLNNCMEILEYEYRMALFCTGSAHNEQLQELNKWQFQKT